MSKKEQKNLGVILDKNISSKSGAGNLEEKPIINESGDYSNYLPQEELQHFEWGDTLGCFRHNAQVLMEDFSTKNIADIRSGEYVITHKGRKKKVTKAIQLKNRSRFLKIHIQGKYKPIRCTKEHPILTVDGWKEAQNLTIKDRVLIPTTENIIKDLTLKEVEKNPDFLWFLGFYLAEGSLSNNKSSTKGNINFTTHIKETEYIKKVQRIGKKLFDTNFNVRYRKKRHTADINGSNLTLKKLLDELGGQHSQDKKINKRLMFLKPELQLNIVKGWLDGDGCYDKKNRRITGVSISERLVQQMYRILLRNRIKCNLRKREAYDNHKEAYTLHIYGTQCNKITDWNLRNLRPNHQDLKSRAIPKFKDNFLVQKITKIEKGKRRRNIYNLEVKDDHSYIVENVAVHNCVTWSALNCIETILKCKYGETWNFSDRFTAKMSGTTKNGNTCSAVADSIRNDGLVEQSDYPSKANSWDEFYKEIPDDIKKKGKNFLEFYDINFKYIFKDELTEAIKRGPVQMIVHAWDDTKKDGEIYQRTSKRPNHGVEGFNDMGNCYEVYDHYRDTTKKISKDFNISAIYQYYITKKKNIYDFVDKNGLLVFNKKTGTYGITEQGKIRYTKNKMEVLELLAAKLTDKSVNDDAWKKLPKESLH